MYRKSLVGLKFEYGFLQGCSATEKGIIGTKQKAATMDDVTVHPKDQPP
jgi:hypothetical protein